MQDLSAPDGAGAEERDVLLAERMRRAEEGGDAGVVDAFYTGNVVVGTFDVVGTVRAQWGEGGFVKTRRMAAAAEEERAPLADTKNATVDVDALWASMVSGSPKQPTEHTPLPPSDTQALDTVGPVSKTAAAAALDPHDTPGPEWG
ncbi:hypothetical protein VE04_09424 [Pseudogymnoascus sp. 24MN13]|nr:hypothetical protein VE04_09424 [Pseudogymnoascus sp. 24MN13]